ncbi:MAG: hypothetical protein JNK82_14625 [Myxococcaceae bacterium]|nr:hypothetical protein [Myxococcaceae bacterium]
MTRADTFVNFTYAMTLLAPVVAFVSFRLPRDVHRKVQVGLVTLCWLAVLVLEVRIRLEGGSGSFIAQAPTHLHGLARTLLRVHIGGAVLTYAVWSWLAVASWRRFRSALPGPFSRRHRLLGWSVFGGLCFTAASATGMYVLTFVRNA